MVSLLIPCWTAIAPPSFGVVEPNPYPHPHPHPSPSPSPNHNPPPTVRSVTIVTTAEVPVKGTLVQHTGGADPKVPLWAFVIVVIALTVVIVVIITITITA